MDQPNFTNEKVRHRKAKQLAQGHTGNKNRLALTHHIGGLYHF